MNTSLITLLVSLVVASENPFGSESQDLAEFINYDPSVAPQEYSFDSDDDDGFFSSEQLSEDMANLLALRSGECKPLNREAIIAADSTSDVWRDRSSEEELWEFEETGDEVTEAERSYLSGFTADGQPTADPADTPMGESTAELSALEKDSQHSEF